MQLNDICNFNSNSIADFILSNYNPKTLEVTLNDDDLINSLAGHSFQIVCDIKLSVKGVFNSFGVLTYEQGNPILFEYKKMIPLKNLTFKKWNTSANNSVLMLINSMDAFMNMCSSDKQHVNYDLSIYIGRNPL